jgi:hypothetical protein
MEEGRGRKEGRDGDEGVYCQSARSEQTMWPFSCERYEERERTE